MSEPDRTDPFNDRVHRQAVISDLRRFASRDKIRQTLTRAEFNAARDSIVTHLPDERAQRWLGKQVCLGLVNQMRAGAFTFDDMDSAMGIASSAYMAAGLDAEQVERWEGISRGAKSLMGDMAQGAGETLTQWTWTQPMVEAICAFQIIAWHRLAALGKAIDLNTEVLPSAWT